MQHRRNQPFLSRGAQASACRHTSHCVKEPMHNGRAEQMSGGPSNVPAPMDESKENALSFTVEEYAKSLIETKETAGVTAIAAKFTPTYRKIEKLTYNAAVVRCLIVSKMREFDPNGYLNTAVKYFDVCRGILSESACAGDIYYILSAETPNTKKYLLDELSFNQLYNIHSHFLNTKGQKKGKQFPLHKDKLIAFWHAVLDDKDESVQSFQLITRHLLGKRATQENIASLCPVPSLDPWGLRVPANVSFARLVPFNEPAHPKQSDEEMAPAQSPRKKNSKETADDAARPSQSSNNNDDDSDDDDGDDEEEQEPATLSEEEAEAERDAAEKKADGDFNPDDEAAGSEDGDDNDEEKKEGKKKRKKKDGPPPTNPEYPKGGNGSPAKKHKKAAPQAAAELEVMKQKFDVMKQNFDELSENLKAIRCALHLNDEEKAQIESALKKPLQLTKERKEALTTLLTQGKGKNAKPIAEVDQFKVADVQKINGKLCIVLA